MDKSHPKKMSKREAGKLGGSRTKERYGTEHYRKIGRIGGKLGGSRTKERYGLVYYQTIGKMGGESRKEKENNEKQAKKKATRTRRPASKKR